ncbi:MAG TPA: geranylgeranylglycerol-phosphate geranylgeranyltransferase [Bacteroidales bacterium]|nr:geranylgeranylglycerol-phosphate geranylgeranyltransferase [Bacteroidales bacterium]
MRPVLQLIRFKNLVIIALTMILMRYGIIQPIFVAYGLSLELPDLYFSLIVIAVMLIAAGGYIINDYFDVNVDQLNKPDKVLIGTRFTARSVFVTYLVLNAIAIVVSVFLLLKTGLLALFFIFPLAIGALWFYSTTYKKQILIGNLIVAILSGIVPILPALYEIPLVNVMYHEYLISMGIDLHIVISWTGTFALFAFILTLAREIIKDAEDVYGDRSYKNSFPLAVGDILTKMIINFLLLVVIFLISYLFWKYLRITNSGGFDYVTLSYFLALIIIPLIITAGIVFKASDTKSYHKASSIIKLIMLAGICYAIVVRFKII